MMGHMNDFKYVIYKEKVRAQILVPKNSYKLK